MEINVKNDRTRASFDYLREMARSQELFTIDDLVAHSGWSKGSADIYISKKFSGVISRIGKKLRVDRKILGVPYDRYSALFKQKRKLFVEYSDCEYKDVTVYEFFLPLTLEHVLRQALDELFYVGTVKNRLECIGTDDVARVFGRKQGESKDALLDRACEFVGQKFIGYSINHVSGRFRADKLLTKEQARKNEIDGESYLIDETTAIARFIIPHEATKINHYKDDAQTVLKFEDISIEDEMTRTEWLFRKLFVEAILQATTDQDEIWLLENGKTTRLFRYTALDKEE